MIYKVAHLYAIGMMAVVAPLAFAGCLAQEHDELASDEVTTDEKLGSTEQLAVCGTQPDDSRIITCQSGWPGSRRCDESIDSPTDIVDGSITVAISGHNGEVSHSASQDGARQIDFTATVHEGDIFSPGKHTTTYQVTWCRQQNH